MISAVTTSVIINVTTKVMATAAPVESSSSDSSSIVPNAIVALKVAMVVVATC